MIQQQEIEPEERVGMTSYRFQDLPLWAKQAIKESSKWTNKKSPKFSKK